MGWPLNPVLKWKQTEFPGRGGGGGLGTAIYGLYRYEI